MAKQHRPRGCWIRLVDEVRKPLGWQAVWDAQPITIAGWEDLNLYIYKTGHHYGRWIDWAITEATTGCLVVAEYGRKATIEACRVLLERCGHEKFMQEVMMAGRKYGQAPKWKEQESGDSFLLAERGDEERRVQG